MKLIWLCIFIFCSVQAVIADNKINEGGELTIHCNGIKKKGTRYLCHFEHGDKVCDYNWQDLFVNENTQN